MNMSWGFDEIPCFLSPEGSNIPPDVNAMAAELAACMSLKNSFPVQKDSSKLDY